MATTFPKKSLGQVRRAAVDLSHFNPVQETTLGMGKDLPLILTPATDGVDLAEWVRANKAELHQKLFRHGGFLYRGFNLRSAEDFERVVAAFCDEVYGEYGDLPREKGIPSRVYHSTWYPNDKSILFHQEMSHFTTFARKINFFSLIVAKQGGCSPIVDCRLVYKALHPKIRQMFEEKGLTYVRNFSPGIDVPWQTFFRTEDKAKVEEHCRRNRIEFEWTHGGEWLRLRQHVRAVATHYATGEKIFFNQVQLHHISCLDQDTRTSLLSILDKEDFPRSVYFGDGTEIPDSFMEHIGETYEKFAVRFQWQAYDMVTLDNMICAHARDPFEGERKILVALGDVISDLELDRLNRERGTC